MEIQSKRVEPSDTFAFTAKAELLLTELKAMEHSTKEIMQQARSQNIEAVVKAVESLATFITRIVHIVIANSHNAMVVSNCINFVVNT